MIGEFEQDGNGECTAEMCRCKLRADAFADGKAGNSLKPKNRNEFEQEATETTENCGQSLIVGIFSELTY